MLSQLDVATPVVDALSEFSTKLQLALTVELPVFVDGVVGVAGLALPPPPHATNVATVKVSVR